MAYNVLLVDDSSIIRKALRKTFSLTDLPVGNFYEAENGKVALDILSNNWIDIIFLDINMPVMNGMEFMREKVKLPSLEPIPVIVVSTEGSQERIDELKKEGVAQYLRKPVTPETLIEAINATLGEVKNE